MRDSTTDRILDVIEAGLQRSTETGYGTDARPGSCARCQAHEPVEGGDLCDGCRAFLLDDSDTDPAHRNEIASRIEDAYPPPAMRAPRRERLRCFGGHYDGAMISVSNRHPTVLIPLPTPTMTYEADGQPWALQDDVARYNVETVMNRGVPYRCLVAPGYPHGNILAVITALNAITAITAPATPGSGATQGMTFPAMVAVARHLPRGEPLYVTSEELELLRGMIPGIPDSVPSWSPVAAHAFCGVPVAVADVRTVREQRLRAADMRHRSTSSLSPVVQERIRLQAEQMLEGINARHRSFRSIVLSSS